MHYKGRKFIQVHSEAEYLIEKKIKINKISYYPIVCLIFKRKNSQEVQMTRNCQKVWLADAALERLETLMHQHRPRVDQALYSFRSLFGTQSEVL